MGIWISSRPLRQCNCFPGLFLPPISFLFVLCYQFSYQDEYGVDDDHFLSFSFFPAFQFASFEKAAEVEEFFKTRAKPSITRTLKQSIERVQINAKWIQSIQNEKHLADAVKELAYRKY